MLRAMEDCFSELCWSPLSCSVSVSELALYHFIDRYEGRALEDRVAFPDRWMARIFCRPADPRPPEGWNTKLRQRGRSKPCEMIAFSAGLLRVRCDDEHCP